jgi:hypothetical protein
MFRIAIVLFVITCIGCSRTPEDDAPTGGSEAEVVDGGTVENADRDQVNEFFGALSKVQSADEEKKLLTEFAQWLKENCYKLEVEESDGEHMLACPYFPPVTPWTRHAFLDLENLELLPRVDNGS